MGAGALSQKEELSDLIGVALAPDPESSRVCLPGGRINCLCFVLYEITPLLAMAPRVRVPVNLRSPFKWPLVSCKLVRASAWARWPWATGVQVLQREQQALGAHPPLLPYLNTQASWKRETKLQADNSQ